MKNRCAWLNHSSNPGAFIRLVHSHPNIRLWFSGAFCSPRSSRPSSTGQIGLFSYCFTLHRRCLHGICLHSGMLLCKPDKRA